jgi:hypothetical protein
MTQKLLKAANLLTRGEVELRPNSGAKGEIAALKPTACSGSCGIKQPLCSG